MKLRMAIGILLLIQAVLFAHMLFMLSESNHAQVVAVGGTVTYVDISPTTFWGGIHGRLGDTGVASDGSESFTVVSQSITQRDIQYVDPDNECGRTELLAAVGPVDPTQVMPITPAAADALLGVSSADGFSPTAMFTQQYVYDIGGQALTLYSTETGGRLRPFIQGIAQAGGNLVFVTPTVSNAQAYDGSPANYQLLLPAGSWTITADDDECQVLSNFTQEEETPRNERLDIAVPPRVCTEQTNMLYSVMLIDRLFCSPEEVGAWWCRPTQADYTVTRGGEQVASGATSEDGAITITPPEEGVYRIRLSNGSQTVQKQFESAFCLEPSTNLVESPPQFYESEPVNVQIAEPPQIQRPETITPLEIAQTEFTIITIIGSLVITLSLFGMLVHYKEATAVLKFRIWLLERLK